MNALLGAIAEQSVSGSLLVRSKAEAAMRVAAKVDFGLSTADLNKIGGSASFQSVGYYPPDGEHLGAALQGDGCSTWRGRYQGEIHPIRYHR